jgi:flagellar hook-associated protein 1 FlgK
MFYTGLSGLNAAQAALVTTGHNTANVNTPGYSRQSAQVATAGGVYRASVGFFGSGVKVVDVTRSYDAYLASQLNQAQSLNQSLTSYYAQISQIDNLLANQKAGLAPQLQALFTNIQAVANTPADPAARQQLISAAQATANQFRAMDQYLSGLNSTTNDQISGAVDQINNYAQQIANLNKQVALLSNASGGQAPNDLLDQRDQLVNQLGLLVGTKLVVQDGGQYNISIGNGQSLVLGDSANKLAAVRSAADPSRIAVAVVNAAGMAVQMPDSMLSGGMLGGLMQFRSETLAPAQNALGRIAIALSDAFNTQHRQGMDLNGALGTDFFTQASPGLVANSRNTGNLVLTPSFSNTSELTTSDYRLDVGAGPSYTLTRLSDNKVIPLAAGFPGAAPANTTSFDGVTLTLASGAGAPGDSFLIQPTRTGARDLTVLVSDPAKIAAASPIVTGNTRRQGRRGLPRHAAGREGDAHLRRHHQPAVGLSRGRLRHRDARRRYARPGEPLCARCVRQLHAGCDAELQRHQPQHQRHPGPWRQLHHRQQHRRRLGRQQRAAAGRASEQKNHGQRHGQLQRFLRAARQQRRQQGQADPDRRHGADQPGHADPRGPAVGLRRQPGRGNRQPADVPADVPGQCQGDTDGIDHVRRRAGHQLIPRQQPLTYRNAPRRP